VSIKRFIPAITWFFFTLVLLCLPGSTIPKYPWLAVIHADKWVHIFLFFVLCFLFGRPLRSGAYSRREMKKWLLLIAVSGIVYGTAMEFVQKYWIPSRSFELGDIMADSAGSLLAYFYALKNWLGRV
jgi:VanZ family protein